MEKWVTFLDVLKTPIRNGLTKPKGIRGTGVKMIAMGEIFAKARISDMEMDRVPVTEKEMANCGIEAGDLLFARQSLVLEGAGKCSIVTEVSEPTVFESHLIRARIDKEKADPYFIFYYFNSSHGRENIKTIVEQVAAAGIRGSDLVKLSIPCPEVSEQRRVARILRSIDERIENNEKINDNLQQQAATIFRQWFVANPESEKWPLVTLDSLTSLVSRGIAPKYTDDSTQIVLNQKCIRDHYIDISLGRRHKAKVINEKWLQYGDLLINSTGEGTLGRAAQVWFTPENMTVDSHVTVVRPKNQLLLFYIGLWGISHEREIESLHTGSTGQTELPRERVKTMELRLPDNDTLTRFNAVIAPMVSLVIANQQENMRLANIRDALLPKLMSGEIDASDIDR